MAQNILSACFPCMRNGDGNTPITTTITVQSTSACCRGKVQKIHIAPEDLEELKEILNEFLKRVDSVKNKEKK